MTECEYEVRDGERILKFTGTLLGESTSRNRNQARWIEFRLFRTRAGAYVLSRIGGSVVYHRHGCSLVKQYNLKPGTVTDAGVPCEQCQPNGADDPWYPERIRYWAQIMEQPAAVREALMKYDQDGTRYLTQVAQRLLAEAGAEDPEVQKVYLTEHVA